MSSYLVPAVHSDGKEANNSCRIERKPLLAKSSNFSSVQLAELRTPTVTSETTVLPSVLVDVLESTDFTVLCDEPMAMKSNSICNQGEEPCVCAASNKHESTVMMTTEFITYVRGTVCDQVDKSDEQRDNIESGCNVVPDKRESSLIMDTAPVTNISETVSEIVDKSGRQSDNPGLLH